MQTIMNLLPMLALLAIVGIVLLIRAAGGRSSPRPTSYSVRARRFLTDREMDFMGRLDEALGNARMHICPQVSFDSILQAYGNDASGRESLRGRYKQMRVDFALMDATGTIRLIVEVDDPSHDSDAAKAKDQFRDELMASAGIPTLRIPKGQLPSASALKASIRGLHAELGIR